MGPKKPRKTIGTYVEEAPEPEQKDPNLYSTGKPLPRKPKPEEPVEEEKPKPEEPVEEEKPKPKPVLSTHDFGTVHAPTDYESPTQQPEPTKKDPVPQDFMYKGFGDEDKPAEPQPEEPVEPEKPKVMYPTPTRVQLVPKKPGYHVVEEQPRPQKPKPRKSIGTY